MPYCPECGGDMAYDPKFRRYTCKSCGLSLTSQEIMEMRDRLRPEIEGEEERRKRKRKEYLKWWFAKKE